MPDTKPKKRSGTSSKASTAPADVPRQEPSKPTLSGDTSVSAIKAAQVPARLRDLPHWLVWRYEDPDKPNGKPRKVPYYVSGKRRRGVLGSAGDVAQLATFDDALAAAKAREFDGVGLAVLPEQGLTIIDLDNCIEGVAHLSEFAKELMATDTYVERSPSGHGLRAVFEGLHLVDGKRNFHIDNGERVEVYEGDAYVTITGRRVSKRSSIKAMPDAMARRLRDGMGAVTGGNAKSTSSAPDGLLSMDAAPLPGMTPRQALRVLQGLPERWGAPEEGTWYKVAAAIHMQFEGSEAGWEVLDEWSRDRPGYDQEANRRRWDAGFSHARGKQAVVSMKNLVFEARDAGVRFKDSTLREWGLTLDKPATVGSDGSAPSGDLVVKNVDDVPMRAIRWLWEPFLACGYLNLLAGETGAAKTNVLMHVAAKLTSDTPLFGQDVDDVLYRKPGRVLYLGNEDSIAELIRPRLVAEGSRPGMVQYIDGVKRDGRHDLFSLQDDLAKVEQLIEHYRHSDAPIQMLVIDPVTAYLSGQVVRKVDLGDNGQLRTILTPWSQMAERTGIAIVAVTHFAKDGNRALLHRVLGAQVFTALCRSLVCAVKLPAEGEHTKALLQVKSNLTSSGIVGGLRYETVLQRVGTDSKTQQPIVATRVKWLGFDAGLTPENLAGGARGPESTYGPQFRGWLRAYFSARPEHDEYPVSEVRAAAMEALGFASSWWEKHAHEFVQKRNVGGTWLCRPVG